MQGAAEINAVSTPNALQLAGPTINLASVVAAYNFASPDAIGYYGSILLDPHGKPIVGTRAGHTWNGPDFNAAVRLADPIVRSVPSYGDHSTRGLVRDTEGDVIAVSVANFMPTPGERGPALLEMARTPRPKLVLIHPVKNLLGKIAATIGAENFRIARPTDIIGANTIALPVHDGAPLTFAWQPRTPGRTAVRRWLPAMLGALALATGLLGIAVLRSLHTTRALHLLATRDQLTGLPNRASLLKELDRRLARGTPVALGLMDLNGFKAVNDTHGHLAGDDLLRAFGTEAGGAIKMGEMLARLGGDEFAYLGASLEDAERFAAELEERLVRPLDLGGTRIHVGSGFGVAVTRPGMTARDLIALADARLYRERPSASARPAARPRLDVGSRSRLSDP